MNAIGKVIALLRQGKLSFVLAGIRKRITSRNQAFGLKRDLTVPFKNPDATIPLLIRPYFSSDKEYFRSDSYNQGIVEADFDTCFVACTPEDEPCYRQWLIGSHQNAKIRDFWKGSFPVLSSDEALLENAYTIPEHRGKRIMPAAMSRIAEMGNKIGARYIITFVGIDNIPSLKGCNRSGFSPYVLRTESWFLFKKMVNFRTLENDELSDFISKIG